MGERDAVQEGHGGLFQILCLLQWYSHVCRTKQHICYAV